MSLDLLKLEHLLDYTDWERGQWLAWFRQQGPEVLKINVGPHGDGRFQAVGGLIRHIFSAEKRYVERLAGRPLTDPASIPTDNVDALFEFGRQSRQELRHIIQDFQDWDVPQEFVLMNSRLTLTPQKIVIHVLTHEIRHWAQIATLLRLQGLSAGFHDFLFSPVLGGTRDT